MIPVQSSNVTSIGYNEETETLRVAFQSGSIYEYYNVPPPIFEQFKSAPSIGSYLNRNIKGFYPYQRVG